MAEIPLSPTPAPVLEYGTPGTDEEPTGGPLTRVASLLTSLIATTSVFLPFTFATSPWAVISEWDVSPRFDSDLLLIALPFLLGPVAAAWHVRQLIRPGGLRVERAALYVLGAAACLTTLFVWGRALVTDAPTRLEALVLTVAPVMTVIGAVLVTRLRRRGWRNHAATVALHTGYATNATMLLILMASPDHPGWWATLVAVVGMGAQTILTLLRRYRLG
jgi:hypothetical protein